jgi:hypothetical protein
MSLEKMNHEAGPNVVARRWVAIFFQTPDVRLYRDAVTPDESTNELEVLLKRMTRPSTSVGSGIKSKLYARGSGPAELSVMGVPASGPLM